MIQSNRPKPRNLHLFSDQSCVLSLVQFIIIFKVEMAKEGVSHKRYSKISLQKRKKIIQMVTELNKSIVQTAKQLKVKLSTAKLILKKYKQTGTFFDKKMPDYCRRKKSQPQQSQKTEKQVKIQEQNGIISLANIPAPEGRAQQKQVGEEGGCKKEEIVPTMVYLYYYA